MGKTIIIQSCCECVHCKKEQDYGEDSWELLYKFTCKKNDKIITRYHDWYSKSKSPSIPDWCPL